MGYQISQLVIDIPTYAIEQKEDVGSTYRQYNEGQGEL
jgi:hypothetical protein